MGSIEVVRPILDRLDRMEKTDRRHFVRLEMTLIGTGLVSVIWCAFSIFN